MSAVAEQIPPPALLIEDLHVAVEGREILRGSTSRSSPGSSTP